MNAFQIMLGQGGIAVGAFVWGSGVAHAGPELTFGAAAFLALAVLALGNRFSINCASEASVDAAPLNPDWNFPACPDHDEGPILFDQVRHRTRIDGVYALMQEIRLPWQTARSSGGSTKA
jgi:hypothetical protein